MDDSRERMSPALQENLLALLCFDDKTCKTIRAAVGSPKIFEGKMYREIAGAAIDFLDTYKAPVKEHLPDELEALMNDSDPRVAAQYEKTIKQLHAMAPQVNSVYVISQLQKFVRLQTMKSALIASVEAAEDGDIEKVEVLWTNALKAQVTTFEPGTNLANVDSALEFLDSQDDPMLIGIEALDHFGVGPRPGTLTILQAPLKRGKSWGLIHIGKMGLVQRLRVLHITLEMSERLTAKRYNQNLFSVTRNETSVQVPRFSRNRDGTMSDVEYEEIETLSYSDPDIRAKLATLIKRRGARWDIRIKNFPSGTLTMEGLEAYVDGLERFEGFVPDLLVLDYAELMNLGKGGKDAADKRAATGKLFVDLRGFAVRRNLRLVTASQTNRQGIHKTVSDETDTAEDISKGFTADTILTYNQTKEEYELGLARIYVAAHRDGEGRQTALISQSYRSGQFCIDSVLVNSKHFEMIERKTNRRRDSSGEDER